LLWFAIAKQSSGGFLFLFFSLKSRSLWYSIISI